MGLLKEGYWTATAQIALGRALPLLYRVSSLERIARCVAAKTLIGVGSKIVDNLVDECFGVERGAEFLRHLPGYLFKDQQLDANPSLPDLAAKSGAMLFRAGQSILSSLVPKDSPWFQRYVDDLSQLCHQAATLRLAQASPSSSPLEDYLNLLDGRNGGIFWFNIEAGVLVESARFSRELDGLLLGIKEVGATIDRSYLLYDDVTDRAEDLARGSWNAVLLESMRVPLSESGRNHSRPTAEQAMRCAIDAVMARADRMFFGAVKEIGCLRSSLDTIDLRGLEFSYRCGRLFWIRKLAATSNPFRFLAGILGGFMNSRLASLMTWEP